MASTLIGVGMGGPKDAWAAAGYSGSGTFMLHTSDGGTTFDKIRPANDTFILLDTASQSPTQAAASSPINIQYSLDGKKFHHSLELGGGQSVEKFGTNGYAVATGKVHLLELSADPLHRNPEVYTKDLN